MEISDLIAALAKYYKEKIKVAPAKTKLLKLAYLTEVYYTRLTRKRLTKQEWIFWKFGPYFREYEELILNELVFIKPDKKDDFYPVDIRDDFEIKEFSLDENIALDRALEHADDDLNQILDFVYFDTEPMMKAQTRGEILDFESIMPEEFYSVKKYKISKKQGKEIIKKIKKWEKKRKSGD
ncbi:MAG: type II toxin-antitoxin system antitoxin SocA domain-containing protein [Promethearchaeota archaeon]